MVCPAPMELWEMDRWGRGHLVQEEEEHCADKPTHHVTCEAPLIFSISGNIRRKCIAVGTARSKLER
jgi:hypothetical protein